MYTETNKEEKGRTGSIIRGVGGLYRVFSDGSSYDCPARGIFRKDGIKPLVGDRVRISEIDEQRKTAVIDRILPRKNSLIRPASANVDMIVAIASAGNPPPDLLLLDKLIVSAEIKKIEVTLAISKSDSGEDAVGRLTEEYKGAVSNVIATSSLRKDGTEELKRVLKGHISILAGQSGAGKSSLINMLCGSDIMATGELSRKTERGRNTTRHTEMFILPYEEGAPASFIIDSPGFSLFETESIKPEELKNAYREIYTHEGACRFMDCSHTGEPDCFVTELVEKGIMPRGRYERYKILYKELKEKERNRYK